MKNIFLLSFLLLTTFMSAQIVFIPDANLKQALILSGVDNNFNNEIEYFEAMMTGGPLNLANKNIQDLSGIEAFSNLGYLDISGNSGITNFNLLYNLTNLYYLNCSGCNLSSLDLSSYTQIGELYCNNNKLTNLDLANSSSLVTIECSNNLLTSLNASHSGLSSLKCEGNPSLTQICVADVNLATTNTTWFTKDNTAQWTSNCLTSLGEEVNQKRSVFPNPTADVIHVTGNIQSLSIVDALGKEILKTNSSMLKVSELPEGIYYAKMIDYSGQTKVVTFVKN